jgi:TPR repeat protein
MPRDLKAHEINKRIKRAKRGCAESAWALYKHFEEEAIASVNAVGDPERRTYLELAADNGHGVAQSFIGEVHFRHCQSPVAPLPAEERESKLKEAVAWFLKAAYNERVFGEDAEVVKRHKLLVSYRLGIIYSQGLGGVEQNHEISFKWFKKGMRTDRGSRMDIIMDICINCQLARMLWDGEGCEKDVVAAERHWVQAVEAVKKCHISRDDLEDLIRKCHDDVWGAHEDSKERLAQLRASKTILINAINRESDLRYAADELEAFVNATCEDHTARDTLHHVARCVMHGRCGLKKNLRLAKDLMKACVRNDPSNEDAEKDLESMRRCVTCGTHSRRTCELCMGPNYCCKDCQRHDWKVGRGGDGDGDDRHELTCPRHITAMPPSAFAVNRTESRTGGGGNIARRLPGARLSDLFEAEYNE